jgi:hypothetical protein
MTILRRCCSSHQSHSRLLDRSFCSSQLKKCKGLPKQHQASSARRIYDAMNAAKRTPPDNGTRAAFQRVGRIK